MDSSSDGRPLTLEDVDTGQRELCTKHEVRKREARGKIIPFTMSSHLAYATGI